MQLQVATREQVKMRLGLSAVSGGGKTYSALLLAYGLCGDWSKIAIIDTENRSASLYSHLGKYNTLPLTPDYSPERYIEAIKTCENAGMQVCIIDSIAHEWEGEGGVLDLCDRIGGGFQSAWKQMTPRHDKFKQAILQSPMHIITTVRRKQEYILTEVTNKQGKTVQAPVKAGMKEITREGWEYELTVNFEIDLRHMCTVSKDRTELFNGKDPFIITVDTGKLIKQWCDEGIDVAAEKEKELKAAIKSIAKCKLISDLTALKSSLPAYIVSDVSFTEAGKARYNVIIAEKPTS
jgi:hypothetical protein